MNLHNAIISLSKRLEQNNNLRVTDNDIKAFNCIIKYVNKTMDKNISLNQSFKKLYTYNLGLLVQKYDTTIGCSIPHSELHQILNTPYDIILENFTSVINYQYKYKVIKRAGIDIHTHPALITADVKLTNLEKLNSILSQYNFKDLFLKDAWEAEEIDELITKQLNNFINEL